MKAMILAAGRGERMGALSEKVPKPLQLLNGKYLIVYQIERLAKAGIREIVINISYKADMIRQALGDGQQWGVRICYSYEPSMLGTAGGVIQALAHFEGKPFILTSADIWHAYDLTGLPQLTEEQGHLILVDNPDHHPEGDFVLQADGLLAFSGGPKKTYAGIALLHPSLFMGYLPGERAIGEIFSKAIRDGKLRGGYYQGLWRNLDTPERLHEIEEYYKTSLNPTF